MEFRRFGKRALQEPSFEVEDLDEYGGALKGALELSEIRVMDTEGGGFTAEGRLSRVLVERSQGSAASPERSIAMIKQARDHHRPRKD
ncbi:hypothetical protein Afil01_69280 [Actinorhabdospora filicis]|uniref:Uncharacterized protein n=1 Tax=Actinorhabdospora filicis TaxID=1785913 RepID=A0A9W6SWR1_9ACTN|nr:hypothetical protein [Actinorhabdospora filicis]GLZ82121.1 hypothetical protein Afil01_69280 [Actinorhabdospora filicis]